MAKQRGNMYSFIEETWNPIVGECGYQCRYCYMKRWEGVIKPDLRIRESVLNKRKHPESVFVCSSLDLFHPSVNSEWIQRIIDRTKAFPETWFLFQSKNPERMMDFGFPENAVLGTTIESNYLPPGISSAPSIYGRAHYIRKLKKAGHKTIITVEPILNFELEWLEDMLLKADPDQVNIGALTGAHGRDLEEPEPDQVEHLISGLRYHLGAHRIHLKSNLKRLRWEDNR